MYNKIIYLDNNATTKVDDNVLKAMLPYFATNYGNPSSLYSFGNDIKKDIEKSKESIAKLINCKKEEILFTSCASESNNAIILSVINNNINKKHIITTSVEHASILETMRYLEQKGYVVTYLKVNEKGNINIDELKSAIREDTLLITVMYANNEVGNIYPIKDICEIANEKNIFFHTDAVQAIGKIKVDVKHLNVDSLSLSGHKIHAAKGVGALYIKDKSVYTPFIHGGHQESGKRAGTENVASIVGMGMAANIIQRDNYNCGIELRDYLEKKIKENIKGYIFYGDKENRLGNTLNVAFKGVKGEELLIMLEQYKIFVSTGSACNEDSVSPSHVLLAMNASLTSSTPIRISLSKFTTKEEIDFFINKLTNITNNLRKRFKNN